MRTDQRKRNNMNADDNQLQQVFADRFKTLPKIIQDAITSADLEKRLRELAQNYKLHIDQWELLENEVKLTLYGFQPTETLRKNIESEVGVEPDVAKALGEGISKIVFEPIRQELERQLEHPEAKAKQVSDMEATRREAMTTETPGTGNNPGAVAQGATPAPVVATPVPEKKAQRAQISPTEAARAPSNERKDIGSDPYREPAV